MRITILTLFPEIFPPIFNASIIGRAQKKGCVTLSYINIRDFAVDKHKSVDDHPYGGGVGMILRYDILHKAIQHSKTVSKSKKTMIVLLDPKGKIFTQKTAQRYTHIDHLIFVCGHYEGVDHRINSDVDELLSLGEFIVTGGEIPAMIVTDAVVRLLPGVLVSKSAVLNESYSQRYVHEPPQYTRPLEYNGKKVPDILLCGDPKKIEVWQNGFVKKTTAKKDF